MLTAIKKITKNQDYGYALKINNFVFYNFGQEFLPDANFWVFQGFGVNTPKRTQNIILKQPKNPEKTPKHTFKTQEATTPITPPLTCGRTRFQTIFN